jgi:hypothetical protein
MMTVNLQMNSNEGKNLVNMEIIHTVDMHRKDMRFTFIIHSYIPSKICIIYIYIYAALARNEIHFRNRFFKQISKILLFNRNSNY